MSDIDKTEKIERRPDEPASEKPKATELTDKSLEQVSGGVGQVTVNKQKAADKAANAIDGYIRG
jgi:bacteriocin-like protein